MKIIYIDKKSLGSLKENIQTEASIGFEPGGDGYAHVTDISEDIDPEDVDLSSFKLKNSLNPKFWKDGKLDSRIRLKLLDIADDFIEFLGTDWVDTEDIIMTGSLANYNWSPKFSDIDLHIIMDYETIDERTELVERFLKAQTMLWNNEHEDLKICGFPVEIYVQDKDAELRAGGVYSLEKNEWIKEPEKDDLKTDGMNRKWIQKKVAKYMDSIDSLVNRYKRAKEDEYKLERIDLSAEKIFKDIKDTRAKGFEENGGEMNDRNIVFKALRRTGYLQKISDLRKNVYNKLNSL